MPLQVWLPVLVAWTTRPILMWATVQAWTSSGTNHALATTTVAGSVLVALMALGTLFRWIFARRALLAVALAHLSSLTITAAKGFAGHTLVAMAAILLVVALSSPTAHKWTNR